MPTYSYTALDDPMTAPGSTIPEGINDAGQIYGYYKIGASAYGFLYSGGTYTTINDPSSSGGLFFDPHTSAKTLLYGVDDLGELVGQYIDSTGRFVAFLYNGGTYTPIDDPLATGTHVDVFSGQDSKGTFASSINDGGQVTGSYVDSSGQFESFFYRDGTYTTIIDPSATYSSQYPNSPISPISGANNAGQLIGILMTAITTPSAFFTAVAPTPLSILLAAISSTYMVLTTPARLRDLTATVLVSMVFFTAVAPTPPSIPWALDTQ